MVYLQKARWRGKDNKLFMRRFGPFPIIRAYGPDACKVDLPETFRMHCTFNVVVLSPFRGTHVPPIPLPQAKMQPVRSHVDRIEAILDSESISSSSGDYVRFLVRWLGRPEAEDSWIIEATLQHTDPDFYRQYMEYMASFHGGESDTGA